MIDFNVSVNLLCFGFVFFFHREVKEEGSLRRARKLSEEKKKAVAGFDPEVFYCSFCCLESVYRDLKLAQLSDALFSDLIDYASVGSLRFFVCVLGICFVV